MLGERNIHELETVSVGDLVLDVSPPTDRATLEVVVDRDASLTVKAPRATTVEQVEAFVSAKRSWIYRRLAEKDALVGPTIEKQFVDGEGFAYLGRSHRLRLDETADAVRLDRGRFVMSPAMAQDGSTAMQDWYSATGRRWLRRRVHPWAARLAVEGVTVGVQDLGYRWGSARPARGPNRINVHWSTMQLPPSLIDYVLVHELAHLREANHTPAFWSVVGQLMPGYEAHKSNLAVIGKNVWLGAVKDEP
jgi:predicted metal-dependent hydrolase